MCQLPSRHPLEACKASSPLNQGIMTAPTHHTPSQDQGATPWGTRGPRAWRPSAAGDVQSAWRQAEAVIGRQADMSVAPGGGGGGDWAWSRVAREVHDGVEAGMCMMQDGAHGALSWGTSTGHLSWCPVEEDGAQ